MSSHRLLLVEDEFLIRLTLSESLSDAGYEVLEAADADEAMRQIEEHPDVGMLLTDIQLPGPVDGHELARRVRSAIPDLPVLFMTGRPDPAAQRNGAARREMTIAKPYLPSDVCLAVGRMLGQSG